MADLVSLLSNALQPTRVGTAVVAPTPAQVQQSSFSNNPFVNYNGNSYSSRYYAQNRPVAGGYFAGYHNGKPNIVGRQLFVEV